MALFDFWKKKEPVGPATGAIWTPQAPAVAGVYDFFGLSRGAWVVHKEGALGVLENLTADGIGFVSLCDKNGENLLEPLLPGERVPRKVVRSAPAADLRRAFIEEIPEARRKHLKDVDLAALGYVKAPQ